MEVPVLFFKTVALRPYVFLFLAAFLFTFSFSLMVAFSLLLTLLALRILPFLPEHLQESPE